MEKQLSADDLSPVERAVFLASCQLEDKTADGRIPVIKLDADYFEACEHLVELGWLERVEVDDKLVGYRLSKRARAANSMQSSIEGAQEAMN